MPRTYGIIFYAHDGRIVFPVDELPTLTTLRDAKRATLRYWPKAARRAELRVGTRADRSRLAAVCDLLETRAGARFRWA